MRARPLRLLTLVVGKTKIGGISPEMKTAAKPLLESLPDRQ